MSANPAPPPALSPFPSDGLADLEALVADLEPAALWWLSGYAAGLAAERAHASGAAPRALPAARAEAPPAATVLYGSQTGNGRRLAERLAQSRALAGLEAKLSSAADFQPQRLANERLMFLVLSTHGDGEAPDDARALLDYLGSRRAPPLEQLGYAVLALGDSSYPQYCAAGRAVDERLAALGARRLQPRSDCDVDIEPKAAPWLEQAVATARAELGSATPRLAVVPRHPPAPTLGTREQPVEVELLTSQRLTARGAGREVVHLELVAPAPHLDYQPGDALGIYFENPLAAVGELLEITGLGGSEPVTIDGRTQALAAWLTGQREIARLARPLLEALAAGNGDATLKRWTSGEAPQELRRAMRELQVADLLRRFPASWDGESLVRALNPLAPRLYSIASSRLAVGDEAHLAVAVIDYRHDGRRRVGPGSWQLAQTSPGTRLRAFIEPNPRFRLPADDGRDVIMIGPGTGVAPYRGFLQQRIAAGARGRHWLFYGGRYRERDFLYQLEWQEALKRGQLQRLDVAFSRDQPQKLYVQQRLREQALELYRWLEGGAQLYLCGDAERMAPDVQAALLEALASARGRGREDAEEYLAQLVTAKRYARDVY